MSMPRVTCKQVISMQVETQTKYRSDSCALECYICQKIYLDIVLQLCFHHMAGYLCYLRTWLITCGAFLTWENLVSCNACFPACVSCKNLCRLHCITWGFTRWFLLFVLSAFHQRFGRYFTDLWNSKYYEQYIKPWSMYLYVCTYGYVSQKGVPVSKTNVQELWLLVLPPGTALFGTYQFVLLHSTPNLQTSSQVLIDYSGLCWF